jgi:transcriptional regulator with XRE-family HTH domain
MLVPIYRLMKSEDQFYRDLGKRVRRARREKDITQQQLADFLSLQRTSITNIEKGIQRTLVHTLVEISQILGVPVERLLPPTKSHQGKHSIASALPATANQHELRFLKSALRKIEDR